jgi:ABC-2 type transport system permease protein
MDDLVEVGVFAERTGKPAGLGETLYLKQHRIRSGKQAITVVVPRRPAQAGIDPYRKFIERERGDNVAAVGSDTAPGGGR